MLDLQKIHESWGALPWYSFKQQRSWFRLNPEELEAAEEVCKAFSELLGGASELPARQHFSALLRL